MDWTRRTFLTTSCASALSLGLGLFPRRSFGNIGPGRVAGVRRGPRGVTLTLELAHGPFPCEGQPYLDATTVVFIPHYYRIPTTERVDVVVYLHEHNTTAAEALVDHEVREQLFASGQNAILCVPQGPVNASDSSGGKLDSENGLAHYSSVR